MKVPNQCVMFDALFLSLSRLQNEGSQQMGTVVAVAG